MIHKEIIEAFSAIAREKNIDRTHLGGIIEELFMALIQKKYGEEYTNFSVIVNMASSFIVTPVGLSMVSRSWPSTPVDR